MRAVSAKAFSVLLLSMLLRLQRDNYLRPLTFEPLDNGIINHQSSTINNL